MGQTKMEHLIRHRQRALRRALATELRRVLDTEGVSLRALGAAVGVEPSHLSRVLGETRAISHDTLVDVATGLGYDVSIRLFGSAGPRVRDRIQVRMIEALLTALHSRWLARLEVAVHRPVRGVIDDVLQDRETWDLVAGEGHSLLSSVEQQLRWAGQKADALPSATGWPWTSHAIPPPAGRLLLLRSSAANHRLVASLPATFRAAYPDSTEAAVAALRQGDRRWPGAALPWVSVSGAETHLMDSVPRAVLAGGR